MRIFLVSLLVTANLVAQSTDVLTHHNGLKRTGTNLTETILTPAAVSPATFGKLFEVPVDGLIYAQPLIVTGLKFKGQRHNVAYVATAHNTLYALDADTGALLWKKNFGPSMPTPNAFLAAVDNNMPYHDLNPEHGTVSTPVIDKDTNTIYMTSFVQRDEKVPPFASFHHNIHALDLVTGQDRFGSPAEIKACIVSPSAAAVNTGVEHHGRHRVNPTLCFDPLSHMQRPALLLTKPAGKLPQIILGFGSHGDYPVFHGWLLSYQANDLHKQLGQWVTNSDNSAQGSGAGIWQSGMGFPVDDDGNFYLMTGNGNSSEVTFGDSLVRFSTANDTIAQTDRFTPCSQHIMDVNDLDLGSSGPSILDDPALKPQPRLVTGGGKQGRVYLWDRDNLGGISTPICGPNDFDKNVLQEFQAVRETSVHKFPHLHGGLRYWRSAARGPQVYIWGENDHLRAYPLVLENGAWRINTLPDSVPPWAVSVATSPLLPWNPLISMMTGGMTSISANGDHDGIIWATTPYNNDANQKVVRGMLHAYDATDLSKELWNSEANPEDDLGNYAKFTPPTVANGKVYLPTFSRRLVVYGLKKVVVRRRAVPNPVQNNGFEQGNSNWKSNQEVFIAPSYSYKGATGGVLCPVILEGVPPQVCPAANVGNDLKRAELSQVITAAQTGRYRLHAHCATNILPYNPWLTPKGQVPAAVMLSVLVNGSPAGARAVSANDGYQVYEIDFAAVKGQKITVQFHAPKVELIGPVTRKLIRPEAWAAIDEVDVILLPVK